MFARNVFLSSLIAIVAVCGAARAAVDPAATGIAATSYVDRAMSAKVDRDELHAVATSGDYADLKNKPEVVGFGDVLSTTWGNPEKLDDLVTDESVPTTGAAVSIGLIAGESAILKNTDDKLSANSSNPVQNKVVTAELDKKENTSNKVKAADVDNSLTSPYKDVEYPTMLAAAMISNRAVKYGVKAGKGVVVDSTTEEDGVTVSVDPDAVITKDNVVASSDADFIEGLADMQTLEATWESLSDKDVPSVKTTVGIVAAVSEVAANGAVESAVDNISENLGALDKNGKYHSITDKTYYDRIVTGDDYNMAPSLSAAKVIAQQAINNEIKAGDGINITKDDASANVTISLDSNTLHAVAKSGDYADLENAPEVMDYSQVLTTTWGSPEKLDDLLTDDSVPTTGAAVTIGLMAGESAILKNTDSELKSTSSNPIQNKVVAAELAKKQDRGTIPVGSATSTTTAQMWLE